MGAGYTVNTDKRCTEYVDFVKKLYDEHKYITFKYQLGKPRSIKQNSALWVFCDDIAERCNAAGYPCVINGQILNKPIEVPWTKRNVMDTVWMTVQRALYPNKTESSSQLSTHEVPLVAETIIKHLAETFGIYVTFADKEFKSGNKA